MILAREQDNPNGGKPIVLVVDDQVGVRRLLFEVLKEDYEVCLAASGMEAVGEVQRQKPQVILLDLKMPGMNGLQALREMRRLGYQGPVVMMTAYDELDLTAQAQKLGAKRYLIKPFDIEDLKNALHEVTAPGAGERSEILNA